MHQTSSMSPAAAGMSSLPILTFDAAFFLRYVEEFDLDEGQQAELLQSLWELIVGFVDLGFHIHPVQQIDGMQKAVEDDSRAMLAFQDIHNTTNSDSVRPHEGSVREGTIHGGI